MTEYDYSHDVYERYLATQRRIALWTEETSRYHPSNPFVASSTEGDRSFLGSPTSSGSHSYRTESSQTRHRSTSDGTHQRPEPTGSYMTHHPSVQRSSAEYVQHSSSRSHSTHHHSSRSINSHQTSGSSRRRATGSTSNTVNPSADRSTYTKRSKPQAFLNPIEIGRYVIIPPKGTRLEVVVSTYLLLLSILAWWVTSDVAIYPHTLPSGGWKE